MPNPWWTLVAVIVGGALTTGGTMVLEWLKDRRDQRRAYRDRLRQNLYDLQDDLVQLFDIMNEYIESKRHPGEAPSAVSRKFNTAVVRISMRSVRVGDDPLGKHIDAIIRQLEQTGKAGDYASTVARMDDAHKSLGIAQMHIGTLLHTAANVDYGISDTE